MKGLYSKNFSMVLWIYELTTGKENKVIDVTRDWDFTLRVGNRGNEKELQRTKFTCWL